MVQLHAGQSELEAIGAAKSGLLSSLEECLGKEPGSLNRRDDKGKSLHFDHFVRALRGTGGFRLRLSIERRQKPMECL